MTEAGSASPPPPAAAPQAKDLAVAALVLNAAAAAAIAADAEDGERLPADPAPTPAVPDGASAQEAGHVRRGRVVVLTLAGHRHMMREPCDSPGHSSR